MRETGQGLECNLISPLLGNPRMVVVVVEGGGDRGGVCVWYSGAPVVVPSRASVPPHYWEEKGEGEWP